MDKESIAFERLRQGAEMSKRYYEKPLMICYSGGKDSDALLELAIRSGIDFEVVHSHTSVDAPETVYYIRQRFKELEERGVRCSIEYPEYKGKRTSMWQLILIKKLPPTRLMRYCCAVLKETSGDNRCIATGVRWAESISRKNKRGLYEDINPKMDSRIILTNDNDDKRRLFERCQMRAKTIVNPIVDWSERDIWDYLKDCNCESNPLYQCGFDRIGCVGCPMVDKKRYFEFRRYPKFKNLYIKTFDRMIAQDPARYKWKNGLECFEWWMGENPNQIKMGLGDE